MTVLSPFQPAGPHRVLRFAGWLIAAVVIVLLIREFSAPTVPAHRPAATDSGTAAPTDAARVTLSPSDQGAIGITFAPVQYGPLDRLVRAVGIVGYDESRLTVVTSKVEGWVESLAVDFTGEQVSRGQPLLTLYAPEMVTAQEELLLGLRLLGELRQGSEDARHAAEELVAASRRKLMHWDVSAGEIAALESRGTAARTVDLRATAAGFAVEKNVLSGQRIMPGDPLYRVADLRTVWVEGEVYERDLPLIQLGGSVRAAFTALPGSERLGAVAYIYPTVNSETRTIRVRVELPNPRLTLRPGMYATLAFESPSQSTLTIPRSAALITGQRSLVFLKRAGGRYEPREVTLGVATDDRYEVLAGLAVGDTVVASGTFLLDAESNLGTMLGGMGGMPGMDMGPAAGPPSRSDSGRPRPPATHQHR